MKKIGLIVLILTAVLILALAFLENRIDGPWGDSSKESRTSTSGTSMTTDTSGTTDVSDTTDTTDVSDTTDTTDASDTTEATDTTAPPPILCTHDWKWESSTAICSKDGESLYRCSLCHETKTEYDPAYGCYDDDTNGLCDGCGECLGACPGKAITDAGVDSWQCSVYYRGAHKSNPFMKDDFLADHPEREAILNGEKRFDAEEAKALYPSLKFLPNTHFGYVPRLCGKSCETVCYKHLKEANKL